MRFCGYAACPACLACRLLSSTDDAQPQRAILEHHARCSRPRRHPRTRDRAAARPDAVDRPGVRLARSIDAGSPAHRRTGVAPDTSPLRTPPVRWTRRPTDLSSGFVELRRGSARVVVWNHLVPLDHVVTIKRALEKPFVHRILAADGLPVPDHRRFDADDLRPALDFLDRQQGACVVKPVDREGGAVTTTGIRTHGAPSPRPTAREADLAAAADRGPGSRRQLPVPASRRQACWT